MTDLALSRPFSPLRLESRSLAWQAGAVIVGSLLLALSSQIKVPMYPVPMTMQTYAVLLVGALCGWRVGLATVMAWLGQAFIGLPMLAIPLMAASIIPVCASSGKPPNSSAS